MEIWALVMFAVAMGALLLGYPVAFTLGAVATLFGFIALGLDFFSLLPLRIWGIMTNFTLLAVPLFIFMGVTLEKSGLAEDLLETMAMLFGRVRGGLAFSVIVVGALLAATTGVVGATVVTMGVIALPAMLKHGYSPSLATGTIAAAGTLGQVIPPSIVLILLADVIGVPIGALFMAAVVPGSILIVLYAIYIGIKAWLDPTSAPAIERLSDRLIVARILKSLIPPLVLIVAVLGSILFGIASPTESAAIGGVGAMALAAAHRRLSLEKLQLAAIQTMRLTSMVFIILIGATAFGLVFKGMGGDRLVHDIFIGLPGREWTFLLVSQAVIFILGFFLDFVEICFIVVPILAPIATFLGLDLLWFALLIAVNLQTSFLTPPFGFSLFYLKAVAPRSIKIQQIYRGVIPFVVMQLLTLTLIITFPQIALWLPNLMDRLNGIGGG
ncbi:MAG: TRAP transporter large permease subunit [Proteobacteria bacterium]|nr:MAG: TRAP transporter large permease subunit [Pseudomonadota bacterium]